MNNTDNEPRIYTVSELNRASKQLIENHFQTIFLQGEISNLARPSSGHIYFSLKDKHAQVRCAMFRQSRRFTEFDVKNGQEIIVQATVSLYEARGDYQLIVTRMQLAGAGALQLAFEQLKNKLSKEGLFSLEHKLPIPRFPQTIGVITSPTGAAIRDVLRVLDRRFPHIPVIIYPSPVQGDQAAIELAKAVQIANDRDEVDVLILTRGGGSIEDLWAFNDEALARSIYVSHIPIITGIGHEIDTTIADFVSDHRAATPSAAAEYASPDEQDIKYLLNKLETQLFRNIENILSYTYTLLKHLRHRLKHPAQIIQNQSQQLDHLEHRLRNVIQQTLTGAGANVKLLARALDAVSPLNTLNRGYATCRKKGKLVTDITAVNVSDELTIRLHNGELATKIQSIKPMNTDKKLKKPCRKKSNY